MAAAKRGRFKFDCNSLLDGERPLPVAERNQPYAHQRTTVVGVKYDKVQDSVENPSLGETIELLSVQRPPSTKRHLTRCAIAVG